MVLLFVDNAWEILPTNIRSKIPVIITYFVISATLSEKLTLVIEVRLLNY